MKWYSRSPYLRLYIRNRHCVALKDKVVRPGTDKAERKRTVEAGVIQGGTSVNYVINHKGSKYPGMNGLS